MRTLFATRVFQWLLMLSMMGAIGGTGFAAAETPLVQAIRYGNWVLASRLVEEGAAIPNGAAGEQDPLGMLANRWWPAETYPERVRFLNLLLDRGADPFAVALTDFYPRGDHSMIDHSLNNSDPRFGDLLLTNRPSPARRTPGGNTALHLAAERARTNSIAALLASGFSPDQTNNDGLTALQYVVGSAALGSFVPNSQRPPAFERPLQKKGRSGSALADVAELLLAHAATLDIFSASGMGLTNRVMDLLKNNPSAANLRDGLGRTPLHYAALSRQSNALALLLDAGGDGSIATLRPVPATRTHAEMPAGFSALHMACSRENAEGVRLLLKAGCRTDMRDADGNTPLHLSAHWGATNCAWLLIGARAALNPTNQAGKTPLQVAVESGAFDNVEMLLKSGARADAVPRGNTLIHVAADQGSPDRSASWESHRGAQTIPVLLRNGMKVDSRDASGRTPLHRAVTSLNWKAMNLLLTNGADVNAADAQGNTALHQLATLAFDMAPYETDAWKAQLQSTNARPAGQQQVRIDGQTNSSVTAWLLQHGANPNLTNHDGRTALELACCKTWGYWDRKTATNRIVLLVKAGATATVLNDEGKKLLEQIRHSPERQPE
ncbi:MAG: hypothetical protein QOF48_2730 [Verrucomicrobiota bacterium]|jgi:ankyrin repeat protein